MAHSLGNDVLMHVLNMCGAKSIELEHAFLWEPAIPDDSFDTNEKKYFAMDINKQNIPYEYSYPKAQQGTKAATVLYSDHDSILGALPPNTKPKVPTSWSTQAVHDFYFGLLSPSQKLLANFAIGTYVMISTNIFVKIIEEFTDLPNADKLNYYWIKGLIGTSDPEHIAALQNKINDPAAGIAFAAIAETIFMLDAYAMGAAGIHRELFSIYHVANLFVYPLSYFLNDDAEGSNCNNYYQQWRTHYQNSQQFPQTLTEQKSYLQKHYPAAYNLLSVGIYIAKHFMQNQPTGIKAALDWYKSPNNAAYAWFNSDKKEAFNNDTANNVAAVILTGLLTERADPKKAMGYNGVHKSTAFYSSDEHYPVPQVAILADHSAMKIPNKEMREKIYRGQLMQKTGTSFEYFGKYK